MHLHQAGHANLRAFSHASSLPLCGFVSTAGPPSHEQRARSEIDAVSEMNETESSFFCGVLCLHQEEVWRSPLAAREVMSRGSTGPRQR